MGPPYPSGVYLLEGRDGSIIISGGMSQPTLLREFDAFKSGGEDLIQGIIILHAHFDHIGIVPFS